MKILMGLTPHGRLGDTVGLTLAPREGGQPPIEVTGQNPASSSAVAKVLMELLARKAA
jgi:hypothetical protein